MLHISLPNPVHLRRISKGELFHQSAPRQIRQRRLRKPIKAYNPRSQSGLPSPTQNPPQGFDFRHAIGEFRPGDSPYVLEATTWCAFAFSLFPFPIPSVISVLLISSFNLCPLFASPGSRALGIPPSLPHPAFSPSWKRNRPTHS